MLLREHSAILLTFITLPFVIKIFILSNFEWLFYTGFTVYVIQSTSICTIHSKALATYCINCKTKSEWITSAKVYWKPDLIPQCHIFWPASGFRQLRAVGKHQPFVDRRPLNGYFGKQ